MVRDLSEASVGPPPEPIAGEGDREVFGRLLALPRLRERDAEKAMGAQMILVSSDGGFARCGDRGPVARLRLEKLLGLVEVLRALSPLIAQPARRLDAQWKVLELFWLVRLLDGFRRAVVLFLLLAAATEGSDAEAEKNHQRNL